MALILERINAFVWGVPAMILILGVGTYLTVRTGFVQLRLLPESVRQFFRQLKGGQESGNGESPFRALCTALAATVGTGNIAGVAGAIALGGPGAVFWMWVSGLIGMGTKYAEAVLAVRYRQKNAKGEYVGGPMYMIRRGLPAVLAPLAGIYSFFGIIAALGVGNATQVNAVTSVLKAAAEGFGWELSRSTVLLIGAVMAAVVVLMVSGGAKKIGQAAELLIPFASVVYILLCLGTLATRISSLPMVLRQILEGAFTPKAVTGGAVGSFFTAMRLGVSRGVFSNEAGMGTAAMAHAGAAVDHPAQQGLMGIMEVFIDTIVICTMTAMVILASGCPVGYGEAAGSELTALALAECYGPWVSVVLSVCLCCFALATVLGWGMYAGRCIEYLFGRINWRLFSLCQGAGVMLGVTLETGVIWTLAETVNGLMAIPNLIALCLLAPEVAVLTRQFYAYRKTGFGNSLHLGLDSPAKM